MQDDALLLHRDSASVRRTARRMAGLGVDRVRLTASWSTLAPASEARRKPAFDAADSREYPREPFAQLDRAVKEVRRAGMDVMIDLAFFAPRWAVNSGSPNRRHAWRPSPREFGLFAHAVAARYNGRFADPRDDARKLPAVRLWTTWNEPNHPSFLRPQWERTPESPAERQLRIKRKRESDRIERRRRAKRPDRAVRLPPATRVGNAERRRADRLQRSNRRRQAERKRPWRPASPHVYRRMHNAAYDPIKAENSTNKVLIGGLAAEAQPGVGARRGIGPLRFTRELACVDGRLRPLRRRDCAGFRPLRADGFSHHPYSLHTAPDARDLTEDRVQIGELDRLTGLLSQLHRRGRIASELPLYLTEYGYETKPPDPTGHTPEDHARYLGQATYLAWQRPEVRMFAQFLLEDIGPDRSKPAGSPARWADYQTGLFHDDGSPKRSVVEAFRLPFWVETIRDEHGNNQTMAFGQVRPGSGRQNVRIERRVGGIGWIPEVSLPVPTSGTRDESCGGFATDVDGYFQRRLLLGGSGTFRAVWDSSGTRPQHSEPVTPQGSRTVLGGIDSLVRPQQP